MIQCDIIEIAMLENPQTEWWYAKDFQHGKYFIGYEASARMSDLYRIRPTLFNLGKDGRFRILSINWDNKKEVEEEKKRLDIKDDENIR